MPRQDFKTWIIIALLGVIGVFIIVFFATRSTYRSEPTSREVVKPPVRAAPLIEGNSAEINKVVPVDQLGGETMSPEELAMLGDRYFEGGNYAQAAEIYTKVLELNPQDIDTYNDLGLAYHYTDRSNMAIDVLKKGTEINPGFQRVWLSLGFVSMSIGLNNEAKAAFQKAVEINPDNDVGIEAQKMLGGLDQ